MDDDSDDLNRTYDLEESTICNPIDHEVSSPPRNKPFIKHQVSSLSSFTAREESLQTTPKLDSLSRIKYGIIKSPWSGCQPSRKDLGTSNVSGVSNPSILMPNTPARGRSNISMDPKSCAGKSGNSFPSSTIDCELHQKSPVVYDKMFTTPMKKPLIERQVPSLPSFMMKEVPSPSTPKLDPLSRIKYGIVKSPWRDCEGFSMKCTTSNIPNANPSISISSPLFMSPNAPGRVRSKLPTKSTVHQGFGSLGTSQMDFEKSLRQNVIPSVSNSYAQLQSEPRLPRVVRKTRINDPL